ncbi:MAG: 30S ribosomal protein S2 [Candidatus Taylorbacteria bacterium RIFCSPHIGHO2_01_FULL_51_15]|uniref:Small ribosomal subunit protein uS2 n=1 Tax=Candidatus Taylorbacteria bacterium RIFCSPHIGHO2_01_FULL_51_15 TaxID=1802304 RepID=A0A1G2M8B9_9BACT|nr:MAG: 30S ribosomal protein S2 [Candidatus Taylorbacteria bacterium RIFCSPHIGHO2_01_FULL_51_15]
MFKAGAHFGYSRSRRHPSVSPYIFGAKNRVEIFDLEETDKLLDEAKAFARTLGKDGKMVLFVGGKPEARDAIKNAAISLGMPYVAGRWIGGTITNWSEIRRRLERLAELSGQRERGELGKYTKKERLLIDREITKLEENFNGIRDMKELPKALFIVDTREESAATTEALRARIPTIALMNSDCDLRQVTSPIVGNDATVQSITFFVQEIAGAYAEGVKERNVVVSQ